MGNAIPLATGSVNQVIVNNVPIGFGSSAFYGPYIDPNEILTVHQAAQVLKVSIPTCFGSFAER